MGKLGIPALVLSLLAGSCTAASAHANGTNLSLVAYSTPKPVLQVLIEAYQKTSVGRGVSFSQSYGSSGSQARAIIAGQPADIAFLSTGLDIDSIAQAGLISKRWTKAPYGGIGADSQVAFVVRKGNPKNIHSWADLIKPGVQVVTPDPFTSGSAKWNVLAAYGAQRRSGKSDEQALAYVRTLFRHVVSQDSSGSNAMATFLAGKGDVVIAYASEAIAAREAGDPIQFVIPSPTMLIELPLVPLAKSPNLAQAKAFINWIHTTQAQEILARGGYQPVEKQALQKFHSRFLPKGRVIFNISDPLFGGWLKANTTWFDPSKGRMVAIEKAVVGPTA